MTRHEFQIFRIKVSLEWIEPEIWREIEIPGGATFWELHVAIQDAMGWTDSHLHSFRLVNPKTGSIDSIGIPEDPGDTEDLPGWQLRIASYLSEKNRACQYEYDFGDGWEHRITLLDIMPRDVDARYPRCTAGGRACPPEDCGGPGGYQGLLEALRSPRDSDHRELLEWFGDRSFDPEHFDPDEVVFDDAKQRLTKRRESVW